MFKCRNMEEKIYSPQEPIINFSDILYVYKFREGEVRRHTVNEHTLVYVYSGELTINHTGETIRQYAGECTFLSRNHKINVSAKPYGGIEFKGVFLTFPRKFLMRYYHQMNKEMLPSASSRRMPDIMRLEKNLHIDSLFQALSTFFIAWEKPTAQYMELKQREGVGSLIGIDQRFCINLFDFVGSWKIDLLEFMNNNYTEDLTLEEMALFTGRSLASFKRDFRRISPLTPHRWVMQKRLEVARDMMLREGKTANSVYLELGFKNLSHFSTAFKRHFGKSPNELFRKQ